MAKWVVLVWLGWVFKGRLVTLSSVVMADAVSALLVTHQEWTRVQKLGKASVSSKRYNEVKIANTNALGKVIAYGMTRAQIKSVYDATLAQPLGTFQLLAPQSGVIINDDFIQGELISPGRILFNIINEDTLWAESQLSPKQAKTIRIGANARIRLSDNNWISGKVIQKRHTLNEKTRTIGIRMTFDNRKDLLHSGMYVDARIEQGQSQKYLAVPTQAVLRSADGDWVVFVEQSASGTFKPVEVEVLQIINNYTVIKGVEAGQRIVFQGAFFVQSELAKSGFSVHNH
ncbi:Probable Co/Zn/Cd efflux system membrane fusion protein [uncultured Gammaproteobacteria bacterium]|nr:Probable Co/Zn/Cd efflux system membrane fusion protein [uncultured Gammaproteobacteria bacterium]